MPFGNLPTPSGEIHCCIAGNVFPRKEFEMRQLLFAPAAIGLAASLLGTTQSRIATAADMRRLSTDEMKATQGKGYVCDYRTCEPDPGPSCNNWGTWSSKIFYNPRYKCRWVD